MKQQREKNANSLRWTVVKNDQYVLPQELLGLK